MSNKNIYTPIFKLYHGDNAILAPTVLYVKQHFITKKKYFGKTIQDPYKYLGSGTHWTNHIKQHGKEFVETLWVSEPFTDKNLIQEFALLVSEEYDIILSKDWLNLVLENGLDGNISTIETVEKMLATKAAKSEEAKLATKEKTATTKAAKSEEAKLATKEKQRATINSKSKEEKQEIVDKQRATKNARTLEQKLASRLKRA